MSVSQRGETSRGGSFCGRSRTNRFMCKLCSAVVGGRAHVLRQASYCNVKCNRRQGEETVGTDNLFYKYLKITILLRSYGTYLNISNVVQIHTSFISTKTVTYFLAMHLNGDMVATLGRAPGAVCAAWRYRAVGGGSTRPTFARNQFLFECTFDMNGN